jgi:hypothetical protein
MWVALNNATGGSGERVPLPLFIVMSYSSLPTNALKTHKI